MTDRRMDAYYYGFDSVGHDAIDKVLSAVACAGKAYHYTAGWDDDETPPPDDHTGNTPVAWIQNAAKEAAARIAALEADLARARERVEALERERSEGVMPQPADYTYPAEAIERAAEDAREWLRYHAAGYPRTWAAVVADDRRRGYRVYDDFQAPPIAGYEHLEKLGHVVRGDVIPDQRAEYERVEFRRTETGATALKPAP